MTPSQYTSQPGFSGTFSIPYALVERDVRSRFQGWVIHRAPFLFSEGHFHGAHTTMAFHHPRPRYPFHTLLVPKRFSRSLIDFQTQDHEFLEDCKQTAWQCVEDYWLDKQGYRLMINGDQE